MQQCIVYSRAWECSYKPNDQPVREGVTASNCINSGQRNTVFPRISGRALISYGASKTRRLNETGRLFEARRLFLISKVRWTYDVSNYVALTWSLSASSRTPPTTAAMAFICAPKTLPAKRKGCLPPSDAPKDNHSTNVIENSIVKLIAGSTAGRSTQFLANPGVYLKPGAYFLLRSETPGV